MTPIRKLHHLYRMSAASMAMHDDALAIEDLELAQEAKALAVRIEQKISKHVTTETSSKGAVVS